MSSDKFQTGQLERGFGHYRHLSGSNYLVSVADIDKNEGNLEVKEVCKGVPTRRGRHLCVKDGDMTSLLLVAQKEIGKKRNRLQTTQPTSGGAVTVVSSCCANCVEPPRPQQ